MEVKYNNKIIHFNDFLTPLQAKNKPDIDLQYIGYNDYILIMYDPDAIVGTHWHWIAKYDSLLPGDTLLNYKGPSPPDNNIHRYIFELYPANKNMSYKPFEERNISLEKGKAKLSLSGEPVLVFQFLSKKMKGGKNKSYKKLRKTRKKVTRRKY
jgi:phosphatidylethanolamine-binding protein (PEBP) family uncharacterized protein